MARRARIPIAAAAACACAFAIVVSMAYGVGFVERADGTALGGLTALHGSRLDPIFDFFAGSADPVPIAAMLTAIVVLGIAAGRRRQAVAALAVVGASTITTEVLKVALAHPRLDPAGGPGHLAAPAFPSGHATAAMAVALAVVLVATPRLRPLAAVAGAVYAIAVSLSILVLGWHFPSDVFGGMLVASFYFCLAVAALRAHAGSEAGAGAGAAWSWLAPRWRAAIVAVAGLVVLVALARAGQVVAFASAHTTATVIVVALAACSAGLVAAATALADR